DFGLARLEDESLGTQLGFGVGTPAYISQEQARGEAQIDSRTDVFGLAATIFHVLSLELPFGKAGAQAATAPPISVRRHQPLLTEDLDAVLQKALELNKVRRYASVSEFREDWLNVRQGRLPRARPVGPLRRAARSIRGRLPQTI